MLTVTDFTAERNSRDRIGQNWDLAVESFINHCLAKNLRESTVKWYKENLSNHFLTFAEQQNIAAPTSLTNRDIDKYMAKLNKEVKDSTVNVRLRALRTFINYLKEEEYIENKVNVKLVKQDKIIIKTFSEQQMKKLIERQKDNNSFADYRDYVIVNFLAGTGVRLGTLVRIKIGDVDFVQREIRLNYTKNRMEYAIPLSVSLAKILQEYIKIRSGELEDYLFCNSFGQRIKERTVQDRIKLYCKSRLGEATDVRCSPHTFRHFFAVTYIRNGGDLLTLQKLLGHKTLDMTRRYVNLLNADVKKEFAQYSPLDSISSVRGFGRKAIKFKR